MLGYAVSHRVVCQTAFITQCSITPPFHHSMYEAEAQASKQLLYCQYVVEIPRRSIIVCGWHKLNRAESTIVTISCTNSETLNHLDI